MTKAVIVICLFAHRIDAFVALNWASESGSRSWGRGDGRPSIAYLWNFLSVVQLSQALMHWFVASADCSSNNDSTEENPPMSIAGPKIAIQATIYSINLKKTPITTVWRSLLLMRSGQSTSGLRLKVAGINTCQRTISNGKQVAKWNREKQ